ncbi:MAG: hypothetical protein IH594_09060 [Bacteroidales bacterium]|nr:hypothetical protein [Bacteroidales bacterium]
MPEREMWRFVIINLEVGWAPATSDHAEQYRSLKEGIHYEFCPWINTISHTFTGIKVYFPDKTEYWDKDGRIWYMLLE